MCCVDFRLVFVIFAIINTVKNKRYDIEQQCKLEYGTDLQGVLRQFRRSDDYVRILKMRTKEFETFYTDIMWQSYEWNVNKMQVQILADLGLNVTPLPPEIATITTTAAGTEDKLRKLKSRFNLRRQGSSGKAARALRKTLANVRRIDKHPKLNQFLTVAQRNHYKNLGFQYAGDIIHAVIHAFGGSLTDNHEIPKGSTLMDPGVTHSTTPSTKHVLRHTVESILRAGTEDKTSEPHPMSRQSRRRGV